MTTRAVIVKETSAGQEYFIETDKLGHKYKYYRCECGTEILDDDEDCDWECEGCGWHFCQSCVHNTNYSDSQSPPLRRLQLHLPGVL